MMNTQTIYSNIRLSVLEVFIYCLETWERFSINIRLTYVVSFLYYVQNQEGEIKRIQLTLRVDLQAFRNWFSSGSVSSPGVPKIHSTCVVQAIHWVSERFELSYKDGGTRERISFSAVMPWNSCLTYLNVR
jgi:hypothetical protein